MEKEKYVYYYDKYENFGEGIFIKNFLVNNRIYCSIKTKYGKVSIEEKMFFLQKKNS